MKKLTLYLAVMLIGVVVFNTLASASQELEKEIYISEVFAFNEVDKYIELYLNNATSGAKYYLMSAASETGSLNASLAFEVTDLDSEYKLFRAADIPDNFSLRNNLNRVIWLCDSKTTKTNCQSGDYVDKFIYQSLNDNEHSWSRDFESDDLAIKESKKTPGEENDFDVPGGNDDNEDPDDEIIEEASKCSSLSLNEISFSEPDRFIEIKNTTAEKINLADCALRRGTEFIYTDGEILPGEIRGYDIVGSTLSQTNNGVNIYIYDKVEKKNVVTVAYKAKSSTSYAWLTVDGIEGWYSTYIMTPGRENEYQSFPNCEAGYHLNVATNKCNKDPDPPAECAEGQYRNPETGRCKKIPEEKVLAECPEGQYRNPATGRCKKYPEEKILAECPEGQFRNPLTNRCKKIATEDDLAPCAEGYERNPETNRCRKIRDSSDAEYAVEPYGVSNENQSWIMIGAAAIAGLGLIIALQFRHEIAQGFNKLIKRIKK